MSEQTLQLPKEGDKVGSGILLSLISTGGSAYIYKTWVESLEIHRAVKVMSPDADPDIRDRFQTEARINSKLLHPHIVQCFNFGMTSSGLPFLEMEYLSGPSLAAVIQKRGVLLFAAAGAASFYKSREYRTKYNSYVPGDPAFDAASLQYRQDRFDRLKNKYYTYSAIVASCFGLALADALFLSFTVRF